MKARIEKTKAKAKGKVLEVFRPRAALNAVVLTLQLLQTTADLVPVTALKAAIGGLLSVIGTLQVGKNGPHSNTGLIDGLYSIRKSNRTPRTSSNWMTISTDSMRC
jgi:hypothetical protein